MRFRGAVSLLAVAATMPAFPALAQAADDTIVVTAQKREETLQSVPISIQALGNAVLDQLQVNNFSDLTRFLPSVTLQTAGPGFSQVYFRGVASGENANHSTSLPTVGIYLDEQPITTIQGALDIHAYDLARVEALAGPQGTLYGASSMAGTIRYITNKPDPTAFSGSVDTELNSVHDGAIGGSVAGYVNIPMTSYAALRVVAWYRHDAGYIDNVLGSRTYPTSGITQSNAEYAKKNYNSVDTVGGRMALGIDLNDSWTIRPTLMIQSQVANGSFAQQSNIGEWKTEQYNREYSKDQWYQAALTVEGKIGSFDLTYAGAYLQRRVDSWSDYSDYSYFYDALYGYGAYFVDNAGNPVNPNQYINGIDRYTKMSHELRIASPADKPLRLIAGLFYQRQTHGITQNYIIDGIADDLKVPGTVSNIWLTKQQRTDRDYAAFGELTYDLTDRLHFTAGGRVYKYKNSLYGFFGYSAAYSSKTGVAACFPSDKGIPGAPCINVDKTTEKTGFIHKLNATWNVTDDALVYATWSRGFRPGGINRRGSLPPYEPDELDNYEIGWKSMWADGLLRFNGAIYQIDWDGIQLSFLGANGLSEVRNAGKARIRGFEADIGLHSGGFTLNASGSYNDAKITRDFCKVANANFDCTTPAGNELLAPSGTRLPITAKFKGNATARYEAPLSDTWKGHLQGVVSYIGERTSDLRLEQRAIKGDFPAYTTVDISIGAQNDRYSIEAFATNLFNANGVINRGLQCNEMVCGDPGHVTESGGIFYSTVIAPRIIGLKFGTKF